jgi:hypothetical protein
LEVQISRDLGATGWEFVEEGMGYEVIEDGSGSGEGRVLRMLVKTGEREMLFVRLVARRGGEG